MRSLLLIAFAGCISQDIADPIPTWGKRWTCEITENAACTVPKVQRSSCVSDDAASLLQSITDACLADDCACTPIACSHDFFPCLNPKDPE